MALHNVFAYIGPMQGGMRLSAGPVAGVIDGTWTKVTAFDAQGVASRGMTFDTATDTFSIDYGGFYEITFTANISFTPVNAGRTFYWRIYNETDVGESAIFPVYVPRNAEGSNISSPGKVDFPSSAAGDSFSIQVGNGDTFSSVQYESIAISGGTLSAWFPDTFDHPYGN